MTPPDITNEPGAWIASHGIWTFVPATATGKQIDEAAMLLWKIGAGRLIDARIKPAPEAPLILP